MSASSNLFYLEEMASDPLSDYEPASAYRAWSTRNNLAHLIDESTQVRINWMGTSVDGDTDDTYFVEGTVEGELTLAYTRRVWSQEFPITWLRDDRPVNLDLHVRIATRGDSTPTLGVTARIVPARFAVGDPAAPVLVEAVATTTTSSSAAAVVDEQLLLTVPAPELDNYVSIGFVAEEEGIFIEQKAAMMRLEIELDESTQVSDARHEIVSVLLREYA